MARYLVVNADDFGQSEGINRGIIAAHERGIVTSASLAVRWPAASEAVSYAREHPRLGLGLHLDFGEWFFNGQGWETLYEVVSVEDETAVREAVYRQLAAFRALAGCDPDHLDSHQHIHNREPARAIVAELGCRLGFPVRSLHPAVRYCGGFYGQDDHGYPVPDAISAGNLVGILEALPAGVTELACHPGDGSPLRSMYVRERALEVQALCDPRVRDVIEREGVKLCSFGDLPALG